MGCIYMYNNKTNGHKYIGLTTNLSKRNSDHIGAAYNSNNKDFDSAFHRALRKYGPSNFDLIVLEDNIEDLEELKKREEFWIQYYNTYENREHYNETPGGDKPGYNTVHLGEDHGMALLTNEKVKFCREQYAAGKRSREIWNEFFQDRITYSGFLRMWHGKNWKHIMPEVFEHNPHRAKYGAADRDIITALYKESGLKLHEFQKTAACYVGYGTLYKMIHNPEFYDNK